MTYAEKYKNVLEFSKDKASRRLKSIEKEGYKYYCNRYYKHIDLLTYPEVYMTEEEKNAKEKALLHIEELKKCADGKTIEPLTMKEWEYLKNTEYPSWRD